MAMIGMLQLRSVVFPGLNGEPSGGISQWGRWNWPLRSGAHSHRSSPCEQLGDDEWRVDVVSGCRLTRFQQSLDISVGGRRHREQ